MTRNGIAGTAADIHEAAPGKNGPVIVPLPKNGDTNAVPAGAKLTDAQFAGFQAGNVYVNVHTAANPGDEMRGQLKCWDPVWLSNVDRRPRLAPADLFKSER